MLDLVLETLFWLILLSYIGARLTRSKKSLKHQH